MDRELYGIHTFTGTGLVEQSPSERVILPVSKQPAGYESAVHVYDHIQAVDYALVRAFELGDAHAWRGHVHTWHGRTAISSGLL